MASRKCRLIAVAVTKRSLDPRAPDAVVIFTKADAARSQVESAIELWFAYGDPLSIHVLAVNANEIYHGIGSKKGLPTIYQTWKRSLTANQLTRANKAHNFAKHARTDPDGKAPVITEEAELLMLDSIKCNAQIYGQYTPLMRCFYGRYTVENPRIVTDYGGNVTEGLSAEFSESLKVYGADKLSRMEHFNMMYPLILAGKV
jgi:hypothetical protein